MTQAGLGPDTARGARCAVVVGTGVGAELSRDEQSRRLYREQAERLHPLTIVRLGLRVVWDTSVSNFNVVRFMLFPGMRKHPANFVRIPLELRDPNGLAVLAMIVCITPGTAWAEISRDRSQLMLHVLEVDDPEEIVQHVKRSYERPLMEIFE